MLVRRRVVVSTGRAGAGDVVEPLMQAYDFFVAVNPGHGTQSCGQDVHAFATFGLVQSNAAH